MVCGLLNLCDTGAGVNHAQFGDDKRNAPRGDIVTTVSYEQARDMIARVSKSLQLTQHLRSSSVSPSDGIFAPIIPQNWGSTSLQCVAGMRPGNMSLQAMGDFIVAHLGHGDTPAECTPEAQHLMSLAADTARFATPFSAALGGSLSYDTDCLTFAEGTAAGMLPVMSEPARHSALVSLNTRAVECMPGSEDGTECRQGETGGSMGAAC